MTPAPRQRLIVLDVPSLVHRAYHAVPQHFSTAAGEPTNAVYGFINMLFRIVDDVQPQHAAAAFDPPGPTFRHEKFEAYKANRPELDESLAVQFGRVHQVIDAFGIPSFELPGYEADDLLGTLAEKGEKEGLDVILVTGDRDAWQLVTPHVKVLSSNPRTGDPVMYDESAIVERWGIAPAQVVDFKGLLGDASDNIPGVAGIGEKTATSLLREYRDLEDVFAHLDDLKPAVRKRLETQRDQAELSRDLARIVTDLPVSLDLTRTRLWQADADAVAALFRELEFRSLLERLPFDGASPSSGDEAGPTLALRVVADETELRELAEALAGSARVGLHPYVRPTTWGPQLLGLGFAWDGEAAFVPVANENGAESLGPLRGWLADAGRPKVTFSSKDLHRALAELGCSLNGVEIDLLLAAYVANPGATPSSLDDLAFRQRGWTLQPPVPEPPESGTMAALDDSDDVAGAVTRRANVALTLASELQAEIEAHDLTALLQDIELPLAKVLADMERRGIKLDVDVLRRLSGTMGREIVELESAIHTEVGHPFNIKSPKQLGVVLFEELGLPAGRKTKSGYSTASGVLEGLVGANPVVQRVLDYRAVTKLRSTYVDALPELVNPATGRLHTTFAQARAATGRLASANPNLQNIPIRTERGREIRRAFVADDDDHLLLSIDYSQIELRVLAHFSEDPAMCEAFEQGQDIHTTTAARMHQVPLEAVSADMRRLAKTTNFGIVYGISAQGLAQGTELSREEAGEFIANYFRTYPGVKTYMDRTIEGAHERGYVQTLLGRRRYLPELRTRAQHERAAAERMAINMPIQGTAADIIKIAMLALARELESRGLASRMLLQVHDELVIEVPRAEVDQVVVLAKQRMREAVRLRVPLVVDAKLGPNWRDMEET